MESPRAKPPLWLLPARAELPELKRRRPLLGYAYTSVLVAAAVPIYMFAMPPTRWEPQALFAVLLCLGSVSVAAHAMLRGSIGFDCAHVVSLTTLVLLGPLAAVAVLAAGEATYTVSREPHDRFVNAATNIGISMWGLVVATICLELTVGTINPTIDSFTTALAVIGAGVAMVAALYATLLPSNVLLDGVPARKVVSQKFIPGWPIDVSLFTVTVLTVALYQEVGLIGLAPLVAIVLMPKLIVPYLFANRPFSELTKAQATRAYCDAIAAVLRLSKHRRDVLLSAADQIAGEPQLSHVDDFQEVMQTVLYANERWDGDEGGFPGVLTGEAIPIESRVFATAQAWADLTASGTCELPPGQALADLRARANAELDPTIVAAAVVAERDGLLPIEQAKRLDAQPAFGV